MSEKKYFITEKFARKLEFEGHIAGEKWDSTFDTAEELKEHVMKDFYYKDIVQTLEMNEQLWEEAFKIWKDSERKGICDSEDFR